MLNAGFKKEHFNVQVDSSGKLSVKGQKKIGDNKCKRFNKVFQLPPDSDIEKIRGKFEGEVLTLNVSRREKVSSDQRGG
jgi:HSP20 family molecular chaperone IbpA